MTPVAAPALLLDEVSKSYPGVLAVDRVSLSVEPGVVHALVGENGAGKSTLMAVASGALRPDSGSVTINGTDLGAGSPARARDLGLALVHQRPALPPDLTVLESFMLLHPRLRADRRGQEWVRSWLEPWGSLASFGPRSLIDDLAPIQRFVVEIARALATEPSVLLLDEPTEHLDQDGAEVLFDYIARLSHEGCSIVYISHRIREVRRLAWRITVLRDGRERGTFATDDISETELVDQIAGRAGTTSFPPKAAAVGEPGAPRVLALEDYETDGVAPLTLEVPGGQILGLAGIDGNGQRELLRSLAGLARSRGRCVVDGRELRSRDVPGATAAGVCLVPGDRHEEGILGGLSVRENVSLMTLRSNARMGFVRQAAERARAREQVRRLDIKTPDVGVAVDSLSGGNQQKVVLSRVLLAEPRVVLADEPTQGVDVGTRAELYTVLRQVAQSGSVVVVLSNDAAELAGLCDRVLVFSRGAVVADLGGAEVTEKAITHAAVTATGHRLANGGRGGPGALTRLLRRPAGPAAVLLLAMLALGAYTALRSDSFLTSLNLTNLMVLASVTAFFALAQQLAILSGGIDLSVGALGGLLVVIASFWMIEGASSAEMAIGVVAMLGAALLVGLLNWGLIDYVGLPAIAATLVTLMGLQGVSLVLRPNPEGVIDPGLIDTVLTKVGPVPVVFVAALVLGLALELASRRSRWGVAVRAIGSDSADARQLGVRDRRVRMTVYVGAALCVLLASVGLMSQVGVGDPGSGVSYTLPSITAVVLGGTSIFGGRGSFIGALAGAVIIEEITNATVFLNLDPAWQLYLVGGLLIVAAAVYSRGARGRSEGGRHGMSALRRRLDADALKEIPPILWGMAGLVVVAALFAPQVLSGSSLRGMLPLAAVLAIAALGQTLVIQQRGFDLSIPGAMALSAVVVTRVAGGDDGELPLAVLAAVGVGCAVGLTNAVLVAWVGVTPLVATLGVNALATGAIRSYSGGIPTNAAPALNDFALGDVLGIPNTVIVAFVTTVVVAAVVGRSVFGRRFVASGESSRAARAAGVRVGRYVFSAYVVSGVFASVAGILLAGYLRTPSIDIGQPYLLSTIAAVVLGGTLLTGGRGRPVGTVIGAVFLTLLVQFVLTLGAPTSVQFIVQAVVIGVAVAIQRIDWLSVAQTAMRVAPTRARAP